ELHTIAPDLISQNIGKTAATAYNATHGYSDQYILELEAFLKIAQKAGLQSEERFSAKYPNSELATVSINLFKGE
ncbi:MAG: class I SAM-dependent methyltransferase, partial [Saprospiraceae bacterium]|nr:class I SAM-dependent methyltransferase [Saprospiraceae bacterium]